MKKKAAKKKAAKKKATGKTGFDELEEKAVNTIADSVAEIAARAIKPELRPFTKKIDEYGNCLEDAIEEMKDIKGWIKQERVRGEQLGNKYEKITNRILKGQDDVMNAMATLERKQNMQEERVKKIFFLLIASICLAVLIFMILLLK